MDELVKKMQDYQTQAKEDLAKDIEGNAAKQAELEAIVTQNRQNIKEVKEEVKLRESSEINPKMFEHISKEAKGKLSFDSSPLSLEENYLGDADKAADIIPGLSKMKSTMVPRL